MAYALQKCAAMYGSAPIAEHHGDDHNRWTSWLFKPFSKVRPGEGGQAVLLLLSLFTILSSYYLMKTAREGLVLSSTAFGFTGAELKSYLGGAMALALLGVVPAYGALAQRMKRIRLITVSYAVVIGCLVVFTVLGLSGVDVGLFFFVWIGCVSVFLIAQFWSYANDLYTEEQGKRLFGMIAIGGSLGAVIGPKLSDLGDTFVLLPMAGGFLVITLILLRVVEARHRAKGPDKVADEPITGDGGFALLFKDRYLLLMGALVLLTQIVNSNGEFILSSAASAHADQVVGAAASKDAHREAIKEFYGNFFFWVNLVGFIVQAFLVSRLIKTLGVRKAVFIMPVISLGAYAMIGFVGGLALTRVAKIAENSTDYSLQNTVRQTLFLPTERAAKYKAKAAIDTFVMRFADTISAVMVAVGVHELSLGARGFALVNAVLVLGWLAVAVGIARRHRQISKDADGSERAAEQAS